MKLRDVEACVSQPLFRVWHLEATEAPGEGRDSCVPPFLAGASHFALWLTGVLAFEVLAGKPLMAPRSSPEEVAARLAGLALVDMAPVDLQLQPVLRSMLSSAPSQRPAVSTFCGSPYFQVHRPFALFQCVLHNLCLRFTILLGSVGGVLRGRSTARCFKNQALDYCI